MYEEHFGLSKNPFQSVAEGEAVFEGPEQKKIIAGLKTALTAKDSIAVVTGPVGVGKTTIVQRALEEAAPDRLVARLGRTAIASAELVDLLLAQFGVVREPTRRFECLKTFNRILNEHAESGARVFIVIEDAERLGAELLEELEALTASDGGSCVGANIILMGPQKLDKLITKPALERLRQRIRLQQTLERFNAEEVETYLRHRISAAGGDYDAMFETGTALMVRRCSGGIPRVINGLCETALTVTAENKMSQVTPKIVFKVGVEVFGMAPGDAPVAQHIQTAPPAPQPTASVANPQAPPAKASAPAAKAPAREQAPAAKTSKSAAAGPAAPTRKPEAAAPKINVPAEKPAAAVEKTDPTIPVAKVAAEAAPEPSAQALITPRAPRPPAGANGSTATAAAATPKTDPSRLPDLPGLGVQDKTPAAANEPLPELPPRFKFADEIVVDRDTRPKLSGEPKKVDPPELPTLEFEEGNPKIVDRKPKKAPVPPTPAADDIPTLGDSARVERVSAEKENPGPAAVKPKAAAARPERLVATPKPANNLPDLSLEEPEPAADRSERRVDDPTASFAKVDHDMLDAALASLAVHDEEDGPPEEALALNQPTADDAEKAPVGIPEVTLDKSIEAKRAAAKAATDAAELDRMAAELEQTQSLEEMSDKLAETLFGTEELEAISMHIRENAAPAEESPVALESTEAADALPTPAAEPAKATAAAVPPSAPELPAAPPKPPAPAKPDAHSEMSREPAAAPVPPPVERGAQPEPIENQFNTSLTATLKTLNSRGAPGSEDADSEESSGGLLGRLKSTFKS